MLESNTTSIREESNYFQVTKESSRYVEHAHTTRLEFLLVSSRVIKKPSQSHRIVLYCIDCNFIDGVGYIYTSLNLTRFWNSFHIIWLFS